MTYRATPESSTQTPDERASEARRILRTMGLATKVGRMTPNHRDFVEKINKRIDYVNFSVSVKELWFLRDLLEWYG